MSKPSQQAASAMGKTACKETLDLGHPLLTMLVYPKEEERKRLGNTRPCPLYIWTIEDPVRSIRKYKRQTPAKHKIDDTSSAVDLVKQLLCVLESMTDIVKDCCEMYSLDFFHMSCKATDKDPCLYTHFDPPEQRPAELMGPTYHLMRILGRCDQLISNDAGEMGMLYYVELDLSKAGTSCL
jgi:hypothetical protein